MITQENIPYTTDEIKAMVKTCEKYNKALERAQKMQENSNGMILKKWLWGVFPELAESEDKRIRKEIIDFVKSRGGFKGDWIAWLEKQEEQKLADKIESRFKVGDLVVSNNNEEVWQIGVRYTEEGQRIYLSNDDVMMPITLDELNNDYHLWTIKDAKDGDVLVDEDNNIGIYVEEKDDVYWHSCIYLGCDNYLHGINIGAYHKHKNTKLATKEQCDMLFQKMEEEGYEWDSKKKEVKKIEVASKDERIRKVIYGWIYTQPSEFFDNGFSKEEMLAWVEKQGEKETTWNKEDEENMNNILYVFNQLRGTSFYKEDDTGEKIINWLKSLKDKLYSNNEYDKDMLGAIEYCKKNNRPLEKEHLAWLEKQGKENQDKENNTYVINNTPNCGISVSVYNEELKENKDERMKEQLCDFLRDNMLYQDAQEITSWLEKLIEKQKD